ncbi:MAG: putative acyltransferase YihG [Candidatus Accumulibacter regalis]|jgi:1-acyl-sn-glycerol-3-phosphate acyltransferase|uniref:Acyltransferase YihG n=1 Tax=Accumulibacter regalis TaxID=522306 RepID=A0A011P6W5_ACCRE|nr:acyltransferase [Accumulibacter sp.]EXI90713.1 MAG: putative acyltransferase YihG [Candidatus Accumulibacter regalis]MQM34363.1 acyltransferase [Candidatus Accumulibacter phosphatis]MBL8367801.1 acyltransferase [Accumulibacter sp.]MBN8514493.1 acyltransferase [Accumulibacter sp.]MBO3702725.1 acyltransferase [Accumulibacter sp.]
MFHFLPAPLLGLIASLLLGLNTLVWVPILVSLAVVKLLLPFKALRLRLDPLLVHIAEAWIAGNSGWMRLTQKTVWDIEGGDGLDRHGWYLVNCNHQSWVDILVLQHLLTGRIPLLKFFLKRQLLWVPVIGLAWWALDFPFMRRHSEQSLEKNPELRGRDQEATRRACARFALIPTSVMNFCEGTRFTPAKQRRQQSPYRHLLRPKAGGIALALNAMGDKFQAILDVTIVYPDGVPNFWAFLCGRVACVRVRVRRLPVPTHLVKADYASDPAVREAFQQWLQQIWQEKDRQIDALLAQRSC